MSTVGQNLATIRGRLAAAARLAGRDPKAVRLVAVSKGQPVSTIREAIAHGQTIFGENYAQDLAKKTAELSDLRLEWHFIGKMQGNKAKMIAPVASWVETIDSFEAALALSQRAHASINVLIEVNIDEETTKGGIRPIDVAPLAKEISTLPHLNLKGLMCIPSYRDDPGRSRPSFRRLKGLAEETRLTELSMGMSHDFEVAIEEGATIIRIGKAIFGKRK